MLQPLQRNRKDLATECPQVPVVKQVEWHLTVKDKQSGVFPAVGVHLYL